MHTRVYLPAVAAVERHRVPVLVPHDLHLDVAGLKVYPYAKGCVRERMGVGRG